MTTDIQGGRQAALRADERIVRANGVDLCVEPFGDPAAPAILLVGGALASVVVPAILRHTS
jgi:hypothetical protein